MDTDKEEEDLHPSELSRCCVARVKVVVHGPHGRYTDYICIECGELCTRYTKCGGADDPWPPDDLLNQMDVTREEWDHMQSSNLPIAMAITVMIKKAARRSKDEREAKPKA